MTSISSYSSCKNNQKRAWRFANDRRIWRLLAELRRHAVMKSRKSFSLLQLSSPTWNQIRTKLTGSHSPKTFPSFYWCDGDDKYRTLTETKFNFNHHILCAEFNQTQPIAFKLRCPGGITCLSHKEVLTKVVGETVVKSSSRKFHRLQDPFRFFKS